MQRLLKAIVVEDNPQICEIISHTLQKDKNITTATAHDLPEAVQLCRREPQVVLVVDLGLPSCHEVEAIQALRKEAPGATVVVLTGQADLEDDALKAGAHAVIIKGGPNCYGEGLVKKIREAVVSHDVELLFAPATNAAEKVRKKIQETGELSAEYAKKLQDSVDANH